MMNLDLPASSIFTSALPTRSETYRVISQDGNKVKVTLPRQHQLSEGQLLLFDSSIKGLITSLDEVSAEVVLSSSQTVLSATSADTYLKRLPKVLNYRVSESFGSGGLEAFCSYVPTHIAGYLGWSLFGPDGTLLALGNDSASRLVCSLPAKGLWVPATYTIKVTAFSSINLAPLASLQRSWVVTEPVSIIKKGSYDDSSSALVLK